MESSPSRPSENLVDPREKDFFTLPYKKPQNDSEIENTLHESLGSDTEEGDFNFNDVVSLEKELTEEVEKIKEKIIGQLGYIDPHHAYTFQGVTKIMNFAQELRNLTDKLEYLERIHTIFGSYHGAPDQKKRVMGEIANLELNLKDKARLDSEAFIRHSLDRHSS